MRRMTKDIQPTIPKNAASLKQECGVNCPISKDPVSVQASGFP